MSQSHLNPIPAIDNFTSKFEGLRSVFDEVLLSLEPRDPSGSKLEEAYLYSLKLPGKRLRPVLCLATGEMLGVGFEELLPVCLAIECIHTATLIHDDLPSIDNDSLRRGEPTCHRVYGEDVALMAGDALLLKAFSVLASAEVIPDSAKVSFSRLLSDAAHSVCVGQVLDLNARATTKPSVIEAAKELETRHSNKTAALITAAVTAPLYLATELPISPEILDTYDGKALAQFGQELGLLFQITDDILDTSQSSEQLGKDANSDEQCGTPTYVSVFGIDRARELALEKAGAARSALGHFGSKAWFLSELVDYVLQRQK